MIKTTAITLSLCLSLLVSGCGFQLRGQLHLPESIKSLSIVSSSPYSPLNTALRNQLRGESVSFRKTNDKQADDSQYQLHILEYTQNRRVLTLGLGSAAAEYLLMDTVSFELKNSSGQVVMGPVTLNEQKIVGNDPNNVVGSEQETSIIRAEMLRTLAANIIRQLMHFDASTGA